MLADANDRIHVLPFRNMWSVCTLCAMRLSQVEPSIHNAITRYMRAHTCHCPFAKEIQLRSQAMKRCRLCDDVCRTTNECVARWPLVGSLPIRTEGIRSELNYAGGGGTGSRDFERSIQFQYIYSWMMCVELKVNQVRRWWCAMLWGMRRFNACGGAGQTWTRKLAPDRRQRFFCPFFYASFAIVFTPKPSLCRAYGYWSGSAKR